jgi:predicted CoA-binding protein
MTDDEIRNILETAKTVAVVGISDNPERPSFGVAGFLQKHGYKIVPVNPTLDRVLGERSVGGLRDIQGPVDVVDIFRRPDAVPPIVEDAIAIGAKVVWMQEGVVNEEAAERARTAGLQVVMDHCMKKEYTRLIG